MIETDSSDGVIAGVLSQEHFDGWRPVAFFSKTMAPAECNYEIHDKEMLAIVKSFKEWRVEAGSSESKIKVFTDHKALEYFMTTKVLTGRQARWAEALAGIDFLISYRPGRENGKVDALTRREDETDQQANVQAEYRTKAFLTKDQIDPEVLKDLGIELDAIDLFPIEEKTIDVPDTLTDRILKANREVDSLEALRTQAQEPDEEDYVLEDGLLLYQGRLVVPGDELLQTALIKEAHDQISSAHPGRNKTYRLLRSRYHWGGMLRTIARYIRNCHACQRAHIPRDKTPGFLHPLPVPERPGQHFTMDFKSFPKDKLGYDSIFVIIDRLSKKPISIPCYKTCTAKDLAQIFIEHVFRHQGIPTSIVSDRGPQFISDFWQEFTRILGIKTKLSTAHKATTDGQTEIMNQYIDQRLRPFVNHYQDNWSQMLPLMDLAQYTLYHESIGMSPYFLQNGYEPRTSFDWNTPKVTAVKEKLNRQEAVKVAKRMEEALVTGRKNMEVSQERMAKAANQGRREVDWDVKDKVWLTTKTWDTDRPSKKLSNQREGPYEVVAKKGHSYELALPESIKIHPVHPPERLRKAADDPLPGQINDPPEPVNITGQEEWEVEKVLASKLYRGKIRYMVQWFGYDPDPQYYPAGNFKYFPRVLAQYHKEYPNKPGTPRSLSKWLELYNAGEEDYEDENDERPLR
jgi:hypothetical protein